MIYILCGAPVIALLAYVGAKDFKIPVTYPRWPAPTPRVYCDHPDCNASFTAQAGLALHDRAAHGEPGILWPRPIPVRCSDIVYRNRPRPALRIVKIGSYKIRSIS